MTTYIYFTYNTFCTIHDGTTGCDLCWQMFFTGEELGITQRNFNRHQHPLVSVIVNNIAESEKLTSFLLNTRLFWKTAKILKR